MDVTAHKHIMLCGDNRNSLCILRSLGERGIRPIIILQNEGNISLLSHSKYLGKIFIVESFDDAIRKLLMFADANCPPFVYLTDDYHLQHIDTNYDKLIDNFYFFNAGKQGRITRFLSKQEQCRLAEKCGLSVPKFEEVKRGELPKALSYPVITKTYNSYSAGWKRDVTICYSSDELLAAYDHMVSERLLLQEYVHKTGEMFLQGVSINGGEDIYIPFEAKYLNYTDTSFGWLSEYLPFNAPELYSKIQKMLREIQFSGCFEIEFLLDEKQQLHFLEINMRFSGANYGVNIGGVNLPYLWAQSTLQNKIDTVDLQLRHGPYIVANDMNALADIKEVGALKMFRLLKSADGYYIYNKYDKLPFYFWLIQKIRRKIKKIK